MADAVGSRSRSWRSSAPCGCLRRRPARAILLLAFPVPFLLFITNTAPASRYLNPVLPFLALFAAWALVERCVPASRATTGVVLDCRGARRSAGRARERRVRLFLRQDDTRTLAQRFIESHIAARARRS